MAMRLTFALYSLLMSALTIYVSNGNSYFSPGGLSLSKSGGVVRNCVENLYGQRFFRYRCEIEDKNHGDYKIAGSDSDITGRNVSYFRRLDNIDRTTAYIGKVNFYASVMGLAVMFLISAAGAAIYFWRAIKDPPIRRKLPW